MTALAPQLTNILENFKKNAPAPVQKSIYTANTDFKAAYDRSAAIQDGDNLPGFRLTNAVGKEVTSTELLAQGPLLITFYRGEWCPFCNLALRAMQKHLDELKARNVTFVAITPELPDTTLSTTEKNGLEFTVLSDVGNKYARELGILFQQPDTLRPIFDKFGHDLKKRNGDDSFALPIPATLLVDQKGIVRNTFIEPDYTKRLEPSEALRWIDAL
ncbi:hypothetical protein LTR10_024105 [Elasticomyces elasticus]|uniref:thioredoxin-dependent peroxiredoxin n=1 Tax=Exophiala sideris TaxID=1016849 RepID=A0ABR0JPB0_9EURO|nr:hypothetical protein LTR10_024105 [Elasticomyces elasticus]KAK5038310.1 hypothetical protein LTS07_001780 [Exophiala sideris]KAK5044294.1 hypothetical protein LTR13_000650 [Exophiala sideris]KAK5067794.1 hypothetical protein LTR69_001783 [Exophiala sideris]KAK5183966.1 hypothetical protein LTR44_003471 [Eurotiomycetes sp. CCFEE 6388]